MHKRLLTTLAFATTFALVSAPAGANGCQVPAAQSKTSVLSPVPVGLGMTGG